MSFVWRRQALRNLVASQHPPGGYGYSCGQFDMYSLVLQPRTGALRNRFRIVAADAHLDNHELLRVKEQERLEAHEKEMEKEAALQRRGATLGTEAKKEGDGGTKETDAAKLKAKKKKMKKGKKNIGDDIPEVSEADLKAAIASEATSVAYTSRQSMKAFMDPLDSSVDAVIKAPETFVQRLTNEIDAWETLIVTVKQREEVMAVLAEAGKAELDAESTAPSKAGGKRLDFDK